MLEKRLAHYRSLAQQGHWHVMDGRRSVSELAEETRAVVGERATGLGPAGEAIQRVDEGG